MLYFYYFLVSIGIILIIISLSDLNIGILILKNGKREEIVLNIKILYGLLKYRIELPFVDILKKGNAINDLNINSDIEMGKQEVIKDSKERDISIEDIKQAYDEIKIIVEKYKKALIYIYHRIVLDKITWATEVGTGDAAVTAVTTGLFWAIKSNIVMYAKQKFPLKEVAVNVVPCYEGERLNTSFNCIFSLKLGYIIIATLKILYRKIKKNKK